MPLSPSFDLPNELLIPTFNLCEISTIGRAASTCKNWAKCANDYALWRNLLFRDYGVQIISKDSFKREYRFRYLTLKNLRNNQRYKTRSLTFNFSLQQSSDLFFNFCLESATFVVIGNNKWKSFDLETGKKKTFHLKIPLNSFFPVSEGALVRKNENFIANRISLKNCSNFACIFHNDNWNLHAFCNLEKQLIEFVTSYTILYQCEENIILYKEEVIEIVNISSKKASYSFKFPNLSLQDLKDDILLLSDKLSKIVGVNVKKGTRLFEMQLQHNQCVKILKMMSLERFIVQINQDQTLVCDSQSGATIYSIPFPILLSPSHVLHPRPLISQAFNKIIAHDSESFYVYDALSGKLEKKYPLEEKIEHVFIAMIHNRLIVIKTAQSTSTVDIYDLLTHQRVVKSDVNLGQYVTFAGSPGFVEDNLRSCGLNFLILHHQENFTSCEQKRISILDLQSGECHDISSKLVSQIHKIKHVLATVGYLVECSYEELTGDKFHFRINIHDLTQTLKVERNLITILKTSLGKKT
jgi:hypothetical protein